MALYAGIDVGSSATKVVIVDVDLRVVGRGLCPSAADLAGAAHRAFQQALDQAGLEAASVSGITSTGYGRNNVDFATGTRTEIDCHGRGAWHGFQRAITVVDIGGQDCKVIRLDGTGRRLDFAMNRKCASGTGAFLEQMAHRLGVPVGQLGALAARSADPGITISSYCTVFAQTEILARIRAGVKAEDLARAALESVAKRVLEQLAPTGEVVATGGVVAHVPQMQTVLEAVLGTTVLLPAYPQHAGALGAALVAANSHSATTTRPG